MIAKWGKAEKKTHEHKNERKEFHDHNYLRLKKQGQLHLGTDLSLETKVFSVVIVGSSREPTPQKED